MRASSAFSWALALLLLFSWTAGDCRAGESAAEPKDLGAFLKVFLHEQPRFRATGVFVSKVPGKPTISCGATVRFDKSAGAVFSYNTTGEELEPYDFYYWKRTLTLLVYDRNRQEILKAERQDAPLRSVFNFVWDVLEEGEKGAGLKTLIFSGLMQASVDQTGGLVKITFRKTLVPLPVKELKFTFDQDYRLVAMNLVETNGSSHSFQVQQYQKITEKLPRPKVMKKAPLQH